eukprot:TRINITY_DN2801_c0_g2_i1.p1 TRINITY_DN2801_c0_g2~~TRINITY_DN2801_c0_g2_i1.p1  ORF type:complete len:915 (-),score=168.77 TRINITY_DN2801_c0_g2_i1:203-2947(-)
MIRRPPRSTHCISSAASDVYKRQGINAEYMGVKQNKNQKLKKKKMMQQQDKTTQQQTNPINCQECEEHIASIICEQCDQSICDECDLRIHNKGKRIKHQRKKLDSTNGGDSFITSQNQLEDLSKNLDQLSSSGSLIKKKQLKLNVNSPDFLPKSEENILKTDFPDTNFNQFEICQSQSDLSQSSPIKISAQKVIFEEDDDPIQLQQVAYVQIPLIQPLARQDQTGLIIEKILRNYAEHGDLMVLWDTFILQVKSKIPTNCNLEALLQSCLDIYHQTMRKFGDTEPTFYVSLHLQTISVQSIIWILESIKRDRMTPSEKLVFSRIKECYGLKINQYYWSCVINQLVQLANSTGEIKLNSSSLPDLKLIKIKDQVNNNEYYQIYTCNESWTIEDTGQIGYEEADRWNDFINFLKEFFKEDNKQLWISSVINIHSNDPRKSIVKPPKSVNRAIPGGRYGCAQLLKCCGPPSLKALSLGKLSLFVQEAITQGILIYYKTLLIKGKLENTNQQLSPQSDSIREKQMKVQLVQNIITEILKENIKGVSLARLPKLVQKRVNFVFDIQDLGFLKLKNLLKTIKGVYIQNDGTTYAMAFYNPYCTDYEQVISIVQSTVDQLLKECKQPQIKIDDLYYQVTKRLGYQMDFSSFQCYNFQDFLQKYLNEEYFIMQNCLLPKLQSEILLQNQYQQQQIILLQQEQQLQQLQQLYQQQQQQDGFFQQQQQQQQYTSQHQSQQQKVQLQQQQQQQQQQSQQIQLCQQQIQHQQQQAQLSQMQLQQQISQQQPFYKQQWAQQQVQVQPQQYQVQKRNNQLVLNLKEQPQQSNNIKAQPQQQQMMCSIQQLEERKGSQNFEHQENASNSDQNYKFIEDLINEEDQSKASLSSSDLKQLQYENKQYNPLFLAQGLNNMVTDNENISTFNQ